MQSKYYTQGPLLPTEQFDELVATVAKAQARIEKKGLKRNGWGVLLLLPVVEVGLDMIAGYKVQRLYPDIAEWCREAIPAHHIVDINNRVSSLALRVSDTDAFAFRLRWR